MKMLNKIQEYEKKQRRHHKVICNELKSLLDLQREALQEMEKMALHLQRSHNMLGALLQHEGKINEE